MPPSEASRQGSRRAPRACRYCRQRKMKCDNRQPSCRVCDLYGKTCLYDELPRRPRPSHSRISELEQENHRLKASISMLQSRSNEAVPTSRTSSEAQSPDNTPPQETGDESVESATLVSPSASRAVVNCVLAGSPVARNAPPDIPAVESRIAISTEGELRYHGPTSTLFEDSAGDRRVLQNVPAAPRVPPAWVQKALMAEAASQRHMETINFSQKKLDFDGVDPDLGMHLLDLHWNRQHHAFLITYRPAFMRDMACGGPYFSKLLLNAIYFGASKFSSRLEVRREPNDVRTAGWRYRQRVRELLGGALDRSDITTIQALLIMASSLFALGDERSAAWLYAGTAFRMIIDLGMHVDGSRLPNYRRFTDEDLEIRRRVFWGAFVVDKIQSLYQGRPVSLQELECSVSIAFMDHYEELEHWKPFAYSATQSHPGSPAYSVSTFTELCKLSLVMNRILNKVYGVRSSKRTPTELAEDLKSLHANLSQWWSDLPSHLTYDPSDTSHPIPPPHVLSLLAMYNVLLILLHRPFVSDGDLHSSPSNAINSFLVCATAAKMIVKILRAYDAAFSIQRAPYLISYATYVSATIHTRIAAQREPGSDAHICLATCLDIFQKNQETNWAVRKANLIIQNLMKRMHVNVEDGQATGDLHEQPGEKGDNRVLRNGIAGSRDNGPHKDHLTHVINGGQPTETIISATNAATDHAASDLDIDAIIQSFIREQQTDRSQMLQYDEATPYQPAQWPPSAPYVPDVVLMQDAQAQNLTHDLYSDNFSSERFFTQFSADDTLFGFNSSMTEGIGWEFDQIL